MITFNMLSTSSQIHMEHGSDDDILKISVQGAYFGSVQVAYCGSFKIQKKIKMVWQLSIGVMIMFHV